MGRDANVISPLRQLRGSRSNTSTLTVGTELTHPNPAGEAGKKGVSKVGGGGTHANPQSAVRQCAFPALQTRTSLEQSRGRCGPSEAQRSSPQRRMSLHGAYLDGLGGLALDLMRYGGGLVHLGDAEPNSPLYPSERETGGDPL